MKKQRMQINKKILVLVLSLLFVILIVWLIKTNIYKDNIIIDTVIIKNVKANKDDSVSFILVNYKKVPVNCSAILKISQNSSIVVRTTKPLGIVKPRQRIQGKIWEFQIPGGLSFIDILPNCTNVEGFG